MSFWRVSRRDESEDVDFGSMHLNETPMLYLVPSTSRRSAQVLASQWLERSYETNRISLAEYQTKMLELRRAVRSGVDSASTCTDGLISSLRQLIACGLHNCRWRLVSVECDHFSSEAWEESFVCLYRNAQCVLSALFRLPDFRKRLFGTMSVMPSVWKLQALMESAWSLGFDPVGASQVASDLGSSARLHSGSDTSASADGRNLVGLVDSTAWLGASDLVSLFGSIGVRCSVLECRAPSGPNNSHPRLLEHVHSYITTGRASNTSLENFSLPMVLQHEGHSRVVIGVEVDEAEQPIALIVLDPNIPVDAMRQICKAADCSRLSNPNAGLSRLSSARYHWSEVLDSLRVDISRVNHPQYQLLQVNGMIDTELDLQDAMVPENVTIAIS